MNNDPWVRDNEAFAMSDIQESGVMIEMILR